MKKYIFYIFKVIYMTYLSLSILLIEVVLVVFLSYTVALGIYKMTGPCSISIKCGVFLVIRIDANWCKLHLAFSIVEMLRHFDAFWQSKVTMCDMDGPFWS